MAGSVVVAFVLIAAFLVGAAGLIGLVVHGMVRAARDQRTRDERLADEHGDLPPGSFRLTPGFGGSDLDGGTGSL